MAAPLGVGELACATTTSGLAPVPQPLFTHARDLSVRTLLPILLAALIPASSVAAQSPDPSKLVGHWTGHGTFFDARLRQRVDSIPFVLHIEPDGSGAGAIGEATLQGARVERNRDYINVKARLSRPVAADPALAKEWMVLVVTALTDTTVQAEFHLKSNSIYDLRMREGRVVLVRSP